MAGALIGGASLGNLCNELLSVVGEVTIKAVMFKSILKRLESVLNQITPIIEDITKLDKLLDRPENETQIFQKQLEKGSILVRKCAKMKWWKCVLRPLYSKRLEGLEDSLLKFFQIDVQLQISRDSRKILVGINEVSSKLDRLGTKGFVGCCGVPGAPEFVAGFNDHLREVKREVIEGRERVVVVSAPGGCGKTTLAKMICHDENIIDKFKENIFFVTFSKTPNLKVIIRNMFHHKGIFVPEFQTVEEAFDQIEKMFQQMGSNPVFMVLDDVWLGSESYIEKFQFVAPDCKILVTSRSVFPVFCSYKLKLLDDQDAMKLFLRAAFPQGGSSQISVDIVNKMVRWCGGFPLALKVVGRSICGQNEVIWKRMLRQWSKGQLALYSDSDLLTSLQSIEALNDIDNVEEWLKSYLGLN